MGSQPGQKRKGRGKNSLTYHCLGVDPQHTKTKMVMVEYRPHVFRKEVNL